jgi:hypothetical protein
MSKEFHREEDDPGIQFFDEYEELDVWDDLLCDLRPKYRTLAEAWEEFKDQNQERYSWKV